MLSDEEKKAIANLKTEYEKLIKENNILFPLYKSDAKRLINLIEKQSKEIEELKLLIGDEKTFIQLGECIGEQKVKGRIKDKIEEVKDGTYDAKIVLESLLAKEC